MAFTLKEGSGVTDQWILEYVVPHTLASNVPKQACVVLGRALLWKVFHESGEQGVPAQIRNRVVNAYNAIGSHGGLEQNENPVKKVPIGVAGVDAELIIEEIFETSEGNADNRVRTGMERQEVRLLSSQVMHLRREIADVQTEQERRHKLVRTQLSRINNNVSRVAAQPGRRRVGDGRGSSVGGTGMNGVPQRRLVASLMSRPKTLHDLWAEWKFGTSGRKPASSFNLSERGKVKSMFSMRKPFWEKVAEMVRSGLTSQQAFNEIYRAYGESTSVTKILRQIKADRRSGQWRPNISSWGV